MDDLATRVARRFKDDDLAPRVARRFKARGGTRNAQIWATKFERTLKKLVDGVRVKTTDGGNVQTYVDVTIDGNPIPQIVVMEERINNSYSKIIWVRINSGPSAKFIKAPTKMAQYVAATFVY